MPRSEGSLPTVTPQHIITDHCRTTDTAATTQQVTQLVTTITAATTRLCNHQASSQLGLTASRSIETMPGLAGQLDSSSTSRDAPSRASVGAGAWIDWGQALGQLGASQEWAQLQQELGDTAGGGTLVGSLMRRALREVAQHAVGAAGPAGPAAGPLKSVGPAAPQQAGGAAGPAGEAEGSIAAQQLVAAVQQAAWEKLHSGCWHAVGVVWRDAYSASCLLAGAAAMLWPGLSTPSVAAVTPPPQQQQQLGEDTAAGGGSQASGDAAGAAARGVREALRELDMAALMGGPLLRPQVDRAIEQLQTCWQHLGAAQQAPGVPPVLPPSLGQPPPAGGAAAAAPERQQVVAVGPLAAGWGAGGDVLLPPGSMGPRGTPVPVEELPSLERFWREYMNRGGGPIPVLIDGGLETWPALRKWGDVGYLRAVAGPRTVPVEVGEHYLADQWGQQLMTLQDFIDRHIPEGAAAAAAAAAQNAAPAGAAAATGETQCPSPTSAAPSRPPAAQQRASPPPPPQQQQQQGPPQQQAPPQQRAQQGQRGYLAQHPLFEQIPALAADIREPDYCVLGEGELQSVNAWFGPPGTVTPLHTDPHHNLLCQVVGSKYVRLYTPQDTPAMYPFSEGLTTNSSQVDMDAPDPQRFPAFAAAPFRDCVLGPGQMLYIPPGWWHYVKALGTSFSVSFWWK